MCSHLFDYPDRIVCKVRFSGTLPLRTAAENFLEGLKLLQIGSAPAGVHEHLRVERVYPLRQE